MRGGGQCRNASVRVGRWHGEPLYHASLSAEEYRHHLAAQGFAVITHVVEDPESGRRTVWLASRAVGAGRTA